MVIALHGVEAAHLNFSGLVCGADGSGGEILNPEFYMGKGQTGGSGGGNKVVLVERRGDEGGSILSGRSP